MCDFAKKKDIPLRLYTRWEYFYIYNNNYKNTLKITDRLYNINSDFYWIDLIKKDIKSDYKNDEVWEVICHPWFFDNKYNTKLWWTKLNKKREKEYKDIIEVSKYLKEKNIKMISFNELK
jgi:predicted glycoside hydrolase/deacetylase ChbG (UPF0249 family)